MLSKLSRKLTSMGVFAFLSMAIESLTGCVGIATVGSVDTTFEEPSSISAYVRRQQFERLEPGAMRQNRNARSIESQEWTRSAVTELLGKPEKVSVKDAYEYWYYDGAWTAKGLVVMVIIPVPLVVPYKHYETVLKFKEDKLQEVALHENGIKFALACGLISPLDRCYAGWMTEDRQLEGSTF